MKFCSKTDLLKTNEVKDNNDSSVTSWRLGSTEVPGVNTTDDKALKISRPATEFHEQFLFFDNARKNLETSQVISSVFKREPLEVFRWNHPKVSFSSFADFTERAWSVELIGQDIYLDMQSNWSN